MPVNTNPNVKISTLGLDAGGARVDNLCRRYLRDTLYAAFEDFEDGELEYLVETGINDFRMSGKRNFVLSSSSPCKINLGDMKLQHPKLQIRRGNFYVEQYVFSLQSLCTGLRCYRADPQTLLSMLVLYSISLAQ